MKLKIREKINIVVLTCLVILCLILGSTTLIISNLLIRGGVAAGIRQRQSLHCHPSWEVLKITVALRNKPGRVV